jgi:hypothetical protein
MNTELQMKLQIQPWHSNHRQYPCITTLTPKYPCHIPQRNTENVRLLKASPHTHLIFKSFLQLEYQTNMAYGVMKFYRRKTTLGRHSELYFILVMTRHTIQPPLAAAQHSSPLVTLHFTHTRLQLTHAHTECYCGTEHRQPQDPAA